MSAIYPKARENLLDWALNGGGPAAPGSVCVIGVTSSYIYSDTHVDLADIPIGDICIAEQILAGVTIVGGLLDATDLSLSGITTGPTLDALIVYFKWAGSEQLLFYIDSTTDSSLPQVLTTDKLNIAWAPSGIGKV